MIRLDAMKYHHQENVRFSHAVSETWKKLACSFDSWWLKKESCQGSLSANITGKTCLTDLVMISSFY